MMLEKKELDVLNRKGSNNPNKSYLDKTKILKYFVLVFLMGLVGVSSGYAQIKRKNLKIRRFPLHDVRLLDSPFKRAQMADAKYMLSLDARRLLVPYYETAGIKVRARKYGGWADSQLSGHILGHYLSALSFMYAATGDNRFKKRVDFIVDQLERCQKAGGDGYIGGIPDGRKLWKKVADGEIKTQNFSLDGVWSPWYNLHKVFAGLRDAYMYTGNEKAKQVMAKFGDWAIEETNHLSDEQFQHMLECEYGGMNEVMADLYRMTGKEKYLDLAKRFNHKSVFTPLANAQDSLAGLHVNTQIPKIIGAAVEYELDSDPRMEKVSSYFWDEVTQKRSFINAEMGYHEYFGRLGTLPRRIGKSSGETGNVYNMLKLTKHLMEWNPKAAYMDYYERALYNDILASQDPETGMMCYFISLEPGFFKTFSKPYDSFWCCVGTGMENHAKYNADIYMHNDSNLYVNLFIPSKLNWQDKGLKLTQKTDFPSDDQTRLELSLDHPQTLALHIRRPYWAGDNFQIEVNGKAVDIRKGPGNYIAIKRRWKDGDNIKVQLPMRLHLERMANDKNKGAIMYGPLVMAGELGGNIPLPYASDQSHFFSQPTVMVPSLTVGDKPIDQWTKSVDNKPMYFKTVGVGDPFDVELAPFYKVNHQHYTVYWDLTATDD